MKKLANVMKFVVAAEMVALFVFTTHSAWDIALLCFAQYAIFFPIDASVIINNVKALKE